MHQDVIEFSPEDAYPARSQRLDDVETVDLGEAEFDTVETIVRQGVNVVVRGLSGASERLLLESLFERIPDAHWLIPISEVRITNRNLVAWIGDQKFQAKGIYTPADRGIVLKRGPREYLSRTFFHEFGHHWLEHVSEAKLAREYQDKARSLDFVVLGQKQPNYQEFWAEAYRARILAENSIISNHPDVYQMIKETEK
jgi:ABC-type sugar transport system ATPase subunit